MIFRSNYSSFISLLYAVVVVAIFINPVAYGQEYDSYKCRPAVGDYSTCSFGEGDPWTIKSDCEGVGENDDQNVLGCCPGNIIATWNADLVEKCSHGSVDFPETTTTTTISKANEEDVDDEEQEQIDAATAAGTAAGTAAANAAYADSSSGSDSTAALTDDAVNAAYADWSSSSTFLSSAMGTVISFVVMIGHYY